jgi:FkbM family methyltransferase
MTHLGQDGAGVMGGDAVHAMQSVGEPGAAQQKLKKLRKEVGMMREKVNDMKVLRKEMKGGSGAQSSKFKVTASKTDGKLSGTINSSGELEKIICTASQAKAQTTRSNKRFNEWWSHSACPDQAWMDSIYDTFHTATQNTNFPSNLLKKDDQDKPFLVLDIGCNKGYTSADFFDALSPGTGMNPKNLVRAIREIAKEDKTKFDREGGVCNDADKPLNKDTSTKRDVEIHCFEPSPATYNMLTRAKTKLLPKEEGAKWHIHNLGVHQVNGAMAWHSACASAVGDELCTIVEEGTEDSISVPVVTVDSFLTDTYKTNEMPLVHMLKVDAEGLDPAVLSGSTELLTQNRAMMVMFEFNPGLGGGEHPHGMWGPKGNPHKDLLEVTSWLDSLGYDCYLDTRVPKGKEVGSVPDAPALYRITGDCLTEEPKVRGWANVVCGSRKWGSVAWELRRLATMVE